MSLAVKLKNLRVKKGKSLQDVANAIGASKTHIWDLETGKAKNPSIDLLTKLADFFKVGIADLVGENPNSPNEDTAIVAMYRDLQTLSETDRETIKMLMDRLKTANTNTD